MNKVIIFLGGLVSGMAAGLVVGKFYYKKIYDTKIEEKINDLEEYYVKRDPYARQSSEEVKETEDENDMSDEEKSMDIPEERSRWRHKNDVKEKIDYTAYYKKDDISEEEIAESVQRNEELEEIRKSGKPPKIISVNALDDYPEEYDRESLIYYYYDQTLTDENDNVIEDVQLTIGDALYKYDFCDNEEEEDMWVVNFELEKIYQVTKILEDYTAQHTIVGGNYYE